MKRTLIALGLFSAAALPLAASAGGLDIGINLGGRGYYAPPPTVVYSAPAPVVYEQPQVVYTAPAPVVYGPPTVVYTSPYHCWWDNGYRVCR